MNYEKSTNPLITLVRKYDCELLGLMFAATIIVAVLVKLG